MNTLKIENAKQTFFTSKQHYLHFRKVWAQAVNSPSAKRRTIPCDEWFEPPKHSVVTISRGTGRRRENGLLTSTHHLIYTLLREKEPLETFKPKTKQNALLNGAYINHGLWHARWELGWIASQAKRYIDIEETDNVKSGIVFAMNKVGEFLKPFDGTITPQMLIDLDKACPKVEPLESNYGIGGKVARVILNQNRKPKTFYDIAEIIEEVK